MSKEEKPRLTKEQLLEFYEHAFIDVDFILFGKKYTIKNFPWCMP